MGVLCLVTLAAYSNSFQGAFVFDNRSLLLQDPRLRQASAENVGLILRHSYWWPKGETSLYRPITTLSYLFNYAMLGGGEQPAGYHWFNFVLHVLNTILLFLLSERFLKKVWSAAFVAGVWAVHPVLTESVTNIIGRSDLLAAACLMSGFLFYLKSTESRGLARFAWLAALSTVTFVGVFSKESAVAIFGVIVVFELTWWKERQHLRGLLLGCAALAPPFLALIYQRAVVLTGSVISEVGFLDNPLTSAHFVTARLTAITVIARYLLRLVWPARLSCDYSYAAIPLTKGSVWDGIAWTILAVVGGRVAWQFKRNKVVFFFAAFAFVSFLPVSNLLFPVGTIMAERFLYLPAAGFVVCLVLAIYAAADRAGRKAAAPIVLCLVMATLGIRTWMRNRDWVDDTKLWTSAIRAVPQSYKGHAALAAALFQSDATHRNLGMVLEEAEKSVAIVDAVPDFLNSELIYADAGLYYMTSGSLLAKPGLEGKPADPQASMQAYSRAQQLLKRGVAIQKAFDDEFRKKERALGKSDAEIPLTGPARLYANLAENSLRVGDPKTAYDAALYARLLDPQNPANYQILSHILMDEGHKDEAAVQLVEGMIASGTQEAEFAEKLKLLYRTGLDPQGCAIVRGPGGESLNSTCEPVHNHLCKASTELATIYQRELRPNMANRARQGAMQLGCRAEAVDSTSAR